MWGVREGTWPRLTQPREKSRGDTGRMMPSRHEQLCTCVPSPPDGELHEKLSTPPWQAQPAPSRGPPPPQTPVLIHLALVFEEYGGVSLCW